ncbi:alpha-hydroxy acid oxidase [Starkeya sp. ORNL1]|uniref:alpha-hydroxy acid oxidase n=1 Tax=Starkeya sp. ORNL1 TaxID=2709380 RepID=UPI001FEDD0D4|nr:alpha-hydroxy acid oxidase [Starkeya sp. ORNL1]
MSAAEQLPEAPERPATPSFSAPEFRWADPKAAASMGRLANVLSLDDFEIEAKRLLPRCIFGFVSGGVESNSSRDANREAFADWAFVPRVLVNTVARSQATTLFGKHYNAPFGISPMGSIALGAFECERVLAAGARNAGIPFMLSGAALMAMEKVIAANPEAWFQAYIPGDRPLVSRLIDRVERAGYGTLVVTADVAVNGNRENNIRNGFSMPLRPTPRLAWDGITHPRWLVHTLLRTLWRNGMPHFENVTDGRGPPLISATAQRSFGRRDSLSWDDIAWIRERWKGTFIIKGILSPEDARKAAAIGADGIIVSNHGGRQLDGAIASLRALPDVVAAAGGLTVMLDSGIRRGTDVVKALALGASFVFLGRPFLFAAAVGDEAGVSHAINVLGEEIDRNLALLGCTDLASLSPAFLVPDRGRR